MIKHHGLRHLALNVQDVEAAVSFYQRVFGMRMAWQPDEDNAYLTSGCDNLALHRGLTGERSGQALDHFGFIVPTVEELQAGYDWALKNRIDIERPLRQHRDGSVSYYIRDPDGNLIQILYEPSISPIPIQGTAGQTD
ncbi:MAG TPA: VOC family protein [Candidatus Binataceae bacterium]|nr:VOC family protein [Candidatus Binataceae bacterium]